MQTQEPAATRPAPRNDRGDIATWTGFLIVAFGVVGLIGAFATFAADIPFDRAMARYQTLDQAELAAGQPAPKSALETLRPALGDSADAVLGGPGDITHRISAERGRMLAAFHAEATDFGFRLRLVIAAFTAAAALFGCMVLSIVRRS